MKRRIVFIGGDRRSVAIMHRLTQYDNIAIDAVGFDQCKTLPSQVTKVGKQVLYKQPFDVYILPLTGLADDDSVEASYTNEELVIDPERFQANNKQSMIFTGVLTKQLKNLQGRNQLQVIALFSKDDVAIYNSIPTAEAALLLALQNRNEVLHMSNILVTGYGRIGQSIARLFSSIGANVFVYTEKSKDGARAYVNGCHLLKDEQSLKDKLSEIDIILNTVPERLFDQELLQAVHSEALLIELSTVPGGVDIDCAKQQGLKLIIGSRLPERYFPRSTGNRLGELIYKYMN